MALPNNLVFVPFDILTADELNQLQSNIKYVDDNKVNIAVPTADANGWIDRGLFYTKTVKGSNVDYYNQYDSGAVSGLAATPYPVAVGSVPDPNTINNKLHAQICNDSRDVSWAATIVFAQSGSNINGTNFRAGRSIAHSPTVTWVLYK